MSPKPHNQYHCAQPLSGNIYLIVTEGETELNYLNALCQRLRLTSTDIVQAKKTNPLGIVKFARDLREKKKAPPYDQTWVVFDTEIEKDRPKLNEALELANSLNINVALSNPCFEFWLLLHKTYTTSPFTNCKEIGKRLREYGDYEKSMSLKEWLQDIPTAVEHAIKCRKHHQKGPTKSCNPCTDVDQLVIRLNDETRPHFQIIKKEKID